MTVGVPGMTVAGELKELGLKRIGLGVVNH